MLCSYFGALKFWKIMLIPSIIGDRAILIQEYCLIPFYSKKLSGARKKYTAYEI